MRIRTSRNGVAPVKTKVGPKGKLRRKLKGRLKRRVKVGLRSLASMMAKPTRAG